MSEDYSVQGLMLGLELSIGIVFEIGVVCLVFEVIIRSGLNGWLSQLNLNERKEKKA